jgi:chromate transporter
MVKGLALAESTPGPLILVTQYVGYLAAYRNPGDLPPAIAGTLGALITTYCTFLPCFLFVFLGAPYIDPLSENTQLQAALVGVTAAVVGVILNLGVFFAIHTFFPQGISLVGIDWFAIGLAIVAFVAIQRFKLPVYWAVLAGGVLGVLLGR